MAKSSVYFLGAGASADAGVPLTDALLPALANRLPPSSPGNLHDFIKRFGFKGKNQSIVDLINFVNSAIRQDQPLDNHFGIEKLRRLREEITVHLSLVIDKSGKKGELLKLPDEAEEQPFAAERRIMTYFRKFARKLVTRERHIGTELPPGDVVITTNYDTNVDAALFELAYADETRIYQGTSNLTDVYLGSSQFRDPYTDEYAFSDPAHTVDLLKLHGSFNWLYCPRCHRIFVAGFGNSVQYLKDRNKDPEESTCFCDYPLDPVIVAPSAEQEISNPHLREIWINAYHALERADRIIICGYSLPPQDLAIRSLFYRAIDGRRQLEGTKPSKIVVVNSSKKLEFRDRYQKLFGTNIDFQTLKFKNWVSSL